MGRGGRPPRLARIHRAARGLCAKRARSRCRTNRARSIGDARGRPFSLAILSRRPAGALCGVLTTLQAAGGARLLPVSCPLALLPIPPGAAPRFGLARPGEDGYDGLAASLTRVEAEGFARLIGAP